MNKENNLKQFLQNICLLHLGEVGGDFEGHGADEIQESLAVWILAVFFNMFLYEIEFAFHHVVKSFAAYVLDVRCQ